MRGYFTFLIVFAAFLLVISLAQFNTNAKTSNLGPAIWVERYYQVQLNAKEAVVEAAREGAREGFFLYSAELTECAIAKCTPECGATTIAAAGCFAGCVPSEIAGSYSGDCLQRKINSAAVEKIKSLNNIEFDSEIAVEVVVSASVDTDTCMPCNSDLGPLGDAVAELSYTAGANKFLNFSDESLYENYALGKLNDSIEETFGFSVADIMIYGNKITLNLEHSGWDTVSVDMSRMTEEMP